MQGVVKCPSCSHMLEIEITAVVRAVTAVAPNNPAESPTPTFERTPTEHRDPEMVMPSMPSHAIFMANPVNPAGGVSTARGEHGSDTMPAAEEVFPLSQGITETASVSVASVAGATQGDEEDHEEEHAEGQPAHRLKRRRTA